MGSASGGNANSYWRTYIEWSSGNYDAYRAWVTVTLYMYFMKAESDGVDMSYNSTSYVQADGQTAGISKSWNHATSAGQYVNLGSYTFYVDRGHGRWINVYGVLGRTAGRSNLRGSSTAGGSEYLYPKSNWAVTYNANGGTGTIASQTKWYGENLTLDGGSGFTWENHTLLKWNTAADGSGTDYALGGTYAANAGTTLYAIWHLDAVEVKTKVSGDWLDGIFYIKSNGEWQIPYEGYVKVNGSWERIKKE